MTSAAPDPAAEPAPFAHLSPVPFDELDPMLLLHNSRYAAHVERATVAFYSTLGRRYERNVADNPDQFHVVRELFVEFLRPFEGIGEMRVELWVDRLGETSCVYGFRCTSPDISVVHARGRRVIVKLDPATQRPSPWTDTFRDAHARLRRTSEAA